MTDASFSAFADELTKIAESKHPALKRWAKNTAILAGAAAGGVGAGMLVERGAQKFLPSSWAKLTPAARSTIKNALVGLTGASIAAASDEVLRERMKKVHENP